MNEGLLGLHASFGYRLPFGERMRLLREAGFEATALWWEERKPEARAMRHLAPDLARKAGLYLDNLHAPYFACNDLWSDNALRRDDAVALHTGWIEDCARHRVPRLVVHVTLGKSPAPPSPEGLDSFLRLTEAAETAGVVLAIENTHSPRHVAFLLEHIDSARLALCFDVAHDRVHSREPLALLRQWGHRLAVLHLSDCDPRRDRHWLPGEGSLDFAAVGAHLNRRALPGVYLLESVGRGHKRTAEEFLVDAIEAARMARAQVREGVLRSAPLSETAHG